MSQENHTNGLPVTQTEHHCHQENAAENAHQCCGGCHSKPDQSAVGAELSDELVREQLKQVIDPELFVNIVDLGLVYNIDIVPIADDPKKHDVNVEMTLTSPMCPAGPQLVASSRQVIEAMSGVGAVDIKVVMDPPWSPDRMSEDARDQLNMF